MEPVSIPKKHVAFVMIGIMLLITIALSATEPMTQKKLPVDIRYTDTHVDIELFSETPFPVLNSLLVLHIGKVQCVRSRRTPDGSLNRIIFMMGRDRFDSLENGDVIRVGLLSFSDNKLREHLSIHSSKNLPKGFAPWTFGVFQNGNTH